MSATLEARLEKLEKANPADPPCFTVEITRQSSHLLTAGEEGAEDIRPARKRRAGHVCGEHCVRVSINRRVKPETVVSAGTRGDSLGPQPALPAPPDASTSPAGPEGQPEAPRAPEPAAGRDEGPQEAAHLQAEMARIQAEYAAGNWGATVQPPARDAVVEMDRATPAALVSPLALEMRKEADARARMLSREVQLRAPWWLPVAEAQLGLCAVPYCSHRALEHRGPRTRLPCICGFRAEQHDPDGIALEVPQYARRVSPCSNYRAIYVDGEDSDRCESPGCACRGWRRWLPMDPRSELMVLQAQIAERDRLIAENDAKLARLRAEYEARQSELVRATSGPADLGPSPHSAPVFVEGEP